MKNEGVFAEFEERRRKVKDFARVKGIPLWKLAAVTGINDGNLSRKLRTLTDTQVGEYCNLIEKIAEEQVAIDRLR